MIGDEGSGYWIGREALAAVMRASDGRGPATRLTRRDPRASQRRRRVAAAANRLRPRGAADDASRRWGRSCRTPPTRATPSRRRILERAADELVLAAQSVASRLEMRGDEFTLLSRPAASSASSRGSPRSCERRLVEVAPRCSVEILNEEPAVGAVWLALAEARGGANVPRYKTLTGSVETQGLGCGSASSDSAAALAQRARRPRSRATLAAQSDARARAADRPHADPAVSRARAASRRGPRRFQPRDHVQPRRVPRRRRRPIRAATARSCSGTCSTT